MVELTDAFVSTLTAAQIRAVAAKPAALSPRLKQCAAAVGVAELESAPGGFSAYLGIRDGQELYGTRIRASVRVDVLSPTSMGAQACRGELDRVRAVLEQGVEGVSILALTARAPEYDPTEDCFRAYVEADCRCWLCAEADPDDPAVLTHFILKGALT